MTEFEPKHPYKMLMIGSSGTGKTSTLLSELIPSDIDKVFVFAPELSLKQKSYQDAKRTRRTNQRRNPKENYQSKRDP